MYPTLAIAFSPGAMLDMEFPTVQEAEVAGEGSIAMSAVVSYLYDGARISMIAN